MVITEITNKDINLKTPASNIPDFTRAAAIRFSISVVPNKTMPTDRQKENAFLKPQRLDNIKSAINKSSQNNGLDNEKW